MNMFKYVRAGVLALAAFSAVFLAPAPSYAATKDLGERSQLVDKSDKVTRKESNAVTAPVAGQQNSITVNQTVHYLNTPFWPWQSNQTYYIKRTATAEYVGRLGYWMLKDSEGNFYKFSPGSTAGTQVSKPVVSIGQQNVMLDQNDAGFVGSVLAGSLSADRSTRSLELTYHYTHIEYYNDVSYTVKSFLNATHVELQNAHMAWVGNRLFKVDLNGNVQELAGKPTVDIGSRSKLISNTDRKVSTEPTVTAGNLSPNGRTRTLISSLEYEHEENFQRLRYSIEDELDASFVPEQSAYMAWIEKRLYRVRVGSDVVTELHRRPVVDQGRRSWKIDFNDRAGNVSVTPLELTTDKRSVVVTVRRDYTHVETFQVKEYYLESREIAHYNSTHKVWTVVIDGRVYAVVFGNETVSDPNVIVIRAPSGINKPDVIIVNPGKGNAGDPPVVIPGKPKSKTPSTDNDDPPVVIPGKPNKAPRSAPTDDDPPVVVPRR